METLTCRWQQRQFTKNRSGNAIFFMFFLFFASKKGGWGLEN